MENFCNGMIWGLAVGAVIGSIVVAKNKKLSSKIRKGLGIAEEKMQEAKDFIDEKVEEIKCECKESEDCDDKSDVKFSNGINKELNKKSKN